MNVFPSYSKGGFDYLVPGAIVAFIATYIYICLLRSSTIWLQIAQYMLSSGYDHVAILRFAANALLGRGAGVFIVPGAIALCITIYGVRRRSWWKSVILFAVCLLVGSITMRRKIRAIGASRLTGSALRLRVFAF